MKRTLKKQIEKLILDHSVLVILRMINEIAGENAVKQQGLFHELWKCVFDGTSETIEKYESILNTIRV